MKIVHMIDAYYISKQEKLMRKRKHKQIRMLRKPSAYWYKKKKTEQKTGVLGWLMKKVLKINIYAGFEKNSITWKIWNFHLRLKSHLRLARPSWNFNSVYRVEFFTCNCNVILQEFTLQLRWNLNSFDQVEISTRAENVHKISHFRMSFFNIFDKTLNKHVPVRETSWLKRSTNFMPVVTFYTPWKHEKARGFQIFSGRIEKVQWHWSGLICAKGNAFTSTKNIKAKHSRKIYFLVIWT